MNYYSFSHRLLGSLFSAVEGLIKDQTIGQLNEDLYTKKYPLVPRSDQDKTQFQSL